MKFLKIIFITFILFGYIKPCYLWEMYRDDERSCCLYLNGADICNPYVPCTRNAAYDLNGIFDYSLRLLLVDKGSAYPYHKILEQAQEFIRHAMMSGMRMYYRFDEHRKVKFYHEIAEATKALEKTSKTSSSANGVNMTTAKKNDEDVVTAMLVKMGLAWYYNPQNKK
ncbi:hypothetical protein KBB68_02055 [Candidatus Babeliales bacterium]|nr:hypothetical protein [Candidatus Babeliales bacterium]